MVILPQCLIQGWCERIRVLNSASEENWEEPSSSTVSTETTFNSDANEETPNVNKTCWQ